MVGRDLTWPVDVGRELMKMGRGGEMPRRGMAWRETGRRLVLWAVFAVAAKATPKTTTTTTAVAWSEVSDRVMEREVVFTRRELDFTHTRRQRLSVAACHDHIK